MLLNGFDFNGKYEGRFDVAEGNAGTTDGGVFVEITKAAADNWRGGVFVNTGIPMNVGDVCKVAFDTTATAPFEVVAQNKQWDEAQYKTVNCTAGIKRTEIEFTVTDSAAGTLWLYVRSGASLNRIELENLSVQKRDSGIITFGFDVFNESHDAASGANQSIKVENGKVILDVQSFGNTDWHNKLESATFDVDGSVDKFIISFKAKATRKISTVFAAPRAGGWDPNLLWTQFYIGTEEQYYFFTTENVTAVGTHQLVWQFGSSENQSFGDVEIEISDIRINLRHGLFDYND